MQLCRVQNIGCKVCRGERKRFSTSYSKTKKGVNVLHVCISMNASIIYCPLLYCVEDRKYMYVSAGYLWIFYTR